MKSGNLPVAHLCCCLCFFFIPKSPPEHHGTDQRHTEDIGPDAGIDQQQAAGDGNQPPEDELDEESEE